MCAIGILPGAQAAYGHGGYVEAFVPNYCVPPAFNTIVVSEAYCSWGDGAQLMGVQKFGGTRLNPPFPVTSITLTADDDASFDTNTMVEVWGED